LELPVQQRLNSASAFDANVPGGGIAPLPTYFSAADVLAAVPTPASTLASFKAFCPPAAVSPVGDCRPASIDNFFGFLTTFPPAGYNTYHGISADFQHRFSKGLYFRTNYTFSKNIDNATNELFSSVVNPRRAQDGFNFAGDRGLSALNNSQK